jgi:hypothetical protein
LIRYGFYTQTWYLCSPLQHSCWQACCSVCCLQRPALLLYRQDQGSSLRCALTGSLACAWLTTFSLSSPLKRPSPTSFPASSRRSRSSESALFLNDSRHAMIANRGRSNLQGARQQGHWRAHP